MESIYYKCQCRKCGRKILVEMGSFGSRHTTKPDVICADCLVIAPQYKKKFPDRAQDIENWLRETPGGS